MTTVNRYNASTALDKLLDIKVYGQGPCNSRIAGAVSKIFAEAGSLLSFLSEGVPSRELGEAVDGRVPACASRLTELSEQIAKRILHADGDLQVQGAIVMTQIDELLGKLPKAEAEAKEGKKEKDREPEKEVERGPVMTELLSKTLDSFKQLVMVKKVLSRLDNKVAEEFVETMESHLAAHEKDMLQAVVSSLPQVELQKRVGELKLKREELLSDELLGKEFHLAVADDDGDCMFHALALQGLGDDQKEVRTILVGFLKSKRRELLKRSASEGGYGDSEAAIDADIARMGESANDMDGWGELRHLQVLAQYMPCRIKIWNVAAYELGSKKVPEPIVLNPEAPEASVRHLLYDGGSHWDGLLPK